MKKFFVEIESERSNIKKVEDLMLVANKEFRLPDDEYGRMMIAVTEIAMNAIVHGNKENIEKKVKIFVECDENKMEITITDEGEGFDMESLADPTLSENLLDLHGRGIFIAKAMVDEFDFKHEKGKGSRFTMVVKKK